MLSYSNRDYESILEDLKNEVKTLTDKWTDFNDSDIGVVWLKTLAGVSAMLHYYIDKQSNETFIGLAQEAKNIESALELLGYRRPLRQASKSTLTIEIDLFSSEDGRLHNNVIIPKYSEFSSQDNKHTCITPEEVVITPFTSSIDIPVIQGVPKELTYKNSFIQTFKFYLPKDNIADNFFQLTIDGHVWEKVDNAFLELDGGRKYSLHRDPYDSHYILFTHDYSKYILSNGNFEIKYISVDTVNSPASSITSANFIPTTTDGVEYANLFTRVYNKMAFVGGVNDIDPYLERAKAQKKVKVLDRLVRLEDYKNFVQTYPGVADADVSDISVKNTTNPKPYSLDIFVLPVSDNGLESMSPCFKNSLLTDIENKQIASTQVYLKDATFRYQEIDFTYIVKDARYLNDSLTNAVNTAIRDIVKYIKFNKPLSVEEIITTILSKFPQIYTARINKPTQTIYPSIGECIVVSSIVVRGEVFNIE